MLSGLWSLMRNLDVRFDRPAIWLLFVKPGELRAKRHMTQLLLC